VRRCLRFPLPVAMLPTFHGGFPTPPRSNWVARRRGRESSPRPQGSERLPELVPWQAKPRIEDKNKFAVPTISAADEFPLSVQTKTQQPISRPPQAPGYIEGNTDSPTLSLRLACLSRRDQEPTGIQCPLLSRMLRHAGKYAERFRALRGGRSSPTNEANQVVI